MKIKGRGNNPILISGINTVAQLNAINWPQYADPKYIDPNWYWIRDAYSGSHACGNVFLSNGDLQKLARLASRPESKWVICHDAGDLYVYKRTKAEGDKVLSQGKKERY